jgi:hypothetical protein
LMPGDAQRDNSPMPKNAVPFLMSPVTPIQSTQPVSAPHAAA